MPLDEEALQAVAKGGMMESEKWAGMIGPLVERLEYIVYNVFPMPKVSPESAPHQPPSADPSSQLHAPNSIPSSSNKENAFPADSQTIPPNTDPAPAGTSPSSERVPDSQSQSFTNPTNETLPTPLVLLLDSIKSTLRSLFGSKPPHTIQRLAELILYPNAHYRTLPAYLRAIDRVISVTTSAEVFPLQMQVSANQPNGVTNGGASSLLFDYAPGSDESLGGALLTPIPWLSNAASFEENSGEQGNEGTESVSITVHHEVQHDPQGQSQGEEQEQQPPSQSSEIETTTTEVTHEATTTATKTLPTHTTSSSPSSSSAIENEALGAKSPPADTEELPHARGPPVVGVEDMGLQDGKGVEMPLSDDEGGGENGAPPASSSDDERTTAKENDDSQKDDWATQSSSSTEGGKKDGDGDISLDDAAKKRNDDDGSGSSVTEGAEESTGNSQQSEKQ